MAENYQKLPGSGTRREGNFLHTISIASCRLWQGDDHLLQVETGRNFIEQYRRFYYRDIQAFVVRRTLHGTLATVFMAVFALLFVLWAFVSRTTVGFTANLILAGLFAVMFLVNFLAGPTCRCHLKTAVQFEELPSLRRVKRARKVITRLRAPIAQAQGEIPREQLAVQYDELLARHGWHAREIVGQTNPADAVATVPYHSRSHHFLFCALLVAALMSALHIFFPGMTIVLLSALMTATVDGLTVVALIRQRGTDLPAAVGRVTWAVAAWAGLEMLIGYALFIIVSANRHSDGTEWGYFKAVAELVPLDTPWCLALLSASTCVCALLGAFGLLLMGRTRRPLTVVPPPAP
ncbi:MAG: hypothetical protein RL380_211 [Verrucomicrobiota bacterium]|jgi:hypothetical protein